jgi:hypothetical protein
MGKVFIADNGLKLVAQNATTSNYTKVPNWEDVEVETIPSTWSNDYVTKDYTAEDDCWVVADIQHNGGTTTGDTVSIIINGYNVSGNGYAGYGSNNNYPLNSTQPVFIKRGTNFTVNFGRNSGSSSIARTLKVYIYGCKEPWE